MVQLWFNHNWTKAMLSDKSTVDGGLKIKAGRETAEIPN